VKASFTKSKFLNPATRHGKRRGLLTESMMRNVQIAWYHCIEAFLAGANEGFEDHIDTGMSKASLRPLAKAVEDVLGPTPITQEFFNFAPYIESRPTWRDEGGKLHRTPVKDRALGEKIGGTGWNIYVGKGGKCTFEYESHIYQWLMLEGRIPPGKRDKQQFQWWPMTTGHLRFEGAAQNLIKGTIPSLVKAKIRASLGFGENTDLIQEYVPF